MSGPVNRLPIINRILFNFFESKHDVFRHVRTIKEAKEDQKAKEAEQKRGPSPPDEKDSREPTLHIFSNPGGIIAPSFNFALFSCIPIFYKDDIRRFDVSTLERALFVYKKAEAAERFLPRKLVIPIFSYTQEACLSQLI